ncbi:unnamed protein product [Danaus chrysippus]|uniref:(African queen) hypothetical protein n=1 Tax=Danaus chrysippus TaxID=151541 RepID=A0A8J2VTD6_9NEOP|nr:unnamed protein product [Danaus chrysippus]
MFLAPSAGRLLYPYVSVWLWMGKTGAGEYATMIPPVCGEAKCNADPGVLNLEAASYKQRGNEVKLVSHHTYSSSPED